MQQLRQENVFDLSKVEFAILEPSGELSILLNYQYSPLTPQDLNVTTHYEGLVTEVILDGKILKNNLAQRNLNSEWLYKELRKKGFEGRRCSFCRSCF